MDFARISPQHDAENVVTLHLTHPYDNYELYLDDERKKPVTIDLIGVDSKAGKNAAAFMVAKINKKRKIKQSAGAMSQGEILKAATDNEELLAELYAAVTRGWENIEYVADPRDDKEKPQALTCTPENAAMLYETRSWITKQVGEFLGDPANFRKDMT